MSSTTIKKKKPVKKNKKTLSKQLERIQDKPAGVLSLPGKNSAASIPGYYHTQTQAADTRLAYRLGAAQR